MALLYFFQNIFLKKCRFLEFFPIIPCMKFEIVIGLETHVRVGSITKMFGSEPNAVALERDPNINV